MAKRKLDPANNEELYGNNAAFCCPACQKVFVVSGFLDKNGRKCPGCGKSTGYVANETAFIEWEDRSESSEQIPPPPMQRYRWSRLNKQQVGAYAEYFVKMELAMHEFQVYSPEVDDRGIDLVTRFYSNPLIAIQVKSVRDFGYVFMAKSKFTLSDELYLALVLLFEMEPPELFLIPSRTWEKPNACFVSRDYGDDKTSPPEWGVNLSKKNIHLLQPFAFEKTIARLCAQAAAAHHS